MRSASRVSHTECSRGWLAVEALRGPSTLARCLWEKKASAAFVGWLEACKTTSALPIAY